jgi:prepilin-type N-terminal cleavage/methylation domain-containing protein
MINKIQSSKAGFTLVEIMIVVAIIALLATIAVPSFLRARKRSQATKVVNDARILDAAIDQWAIESNQTNQATVNWDDIKLFVKDSSLLYKKAGSDIFDKPYDLGKVDDGVTVNTDTYDSLKDVASEADFWGSYAPNP